jgi:hypothetical protein
MRAKLALLCALSAATSLALAGCQTYDFEPVDPLAVGQTEFEKEIVARNPPPNLLLLVDTSGSMNLRVDASCVGTSCDSRWEALQGAMGPFIEATGSSVRMGLVTYPTVDAQLSSPECGAARVDSVRQPLLTSTDEPTQLASHASAIRAVIDSIPSSAMNGGTPTARSLNFAGSVLPAQPEPGRENIVLLLTDGVPNCNAENPNVPDINGGASAGACRCTLGQQTVGGTPVSGCFACSGTQASCQPNPVGCLDRDASVSAVSALSQQKIRTIVVGFGAETGAGDGFNTLQDMAQQGGFARRCDRNGSCGAGDTCDTATNTCARKYYQAANQVELTQVLDAITKVVIVNDPCFYPLASDQMPSAEELLVVYFETDGPITSADTAKPPADTWRLVTDPATREDGRTGVEFIGQACERILNATSSSKVWVSIRAVQVH